MVKYTVSPILLFSDFLKDHFNTINMPKMDLNAGLLLVFHYYKREGDRNILSLNARVRFRALLEFID